MLHEMIRHENTRTTTAADAPSILLVARSCACETARHRCVQQPALKAQEVVLVVAIAVPVSTAGTYLG